MGLQLRGRNKIVDCVVTELSQSTMAEAGRACRETNRGFCVWSAMFRVHLSEMQTIFLRGPILLCYRTKQSNGNRTQFRKKVHATEGSLLNINECHTPMIHAAVHRFGAGGGTRKRYQAGQLVGLSSQQVPADPDALQLASRQAMRCCETFQIAADDDPQMVPDALRTCSVALLCTVMPQETAGTIGTAADRDRFEKRPGGRQAGVQKGQIVLYHDNFLRRKHLVRSRVRYVPLATTFSLSWSPLSAGSRSTRFARTGAGCTCAYLILMLVLIFVRKRRAGGRSFGLDSPGGGRSFAFQLEKAA